MATPERRPRRNLRVQLEQEVVAPLFEDVTPAAPDDASIPEIVLRNRRNRARERVLDALASRGSAEAPQDLLKDARRLIRRWAAAGFTDGFKEAEEFEIRCAHEHDLVIALESGDMELVLEVYEKDYRRRVIEQFGRIELRGIQTAHRVLQDVEKIYVPLHLEPRPEEVEGERGKVITVLARTRIPVPEVLKEHRHVLIVGAPGSGKSTLIGYLATRSAAGQFANELGENRELLPFVVTVRALKKPALTPRGIAEHVSCRVEVIQRALQQQRAFLLVDGLDEAPQETRAELVGVLLRFVGGQAEGRIVVTSRPAGAPGEVEKSLPGFQPFQLAALLPQEVDAFIEKWCLAAETSVRKDASEAEKEAAKAAADLKRRLEMSYAVQKIAANPLLTTILCVVHRFLGRTIPEHRVTLYQKCTDALLYEWDQAKFPEGAAVGYLDADAKRYLLTGVARANHERHTAEIDEQEVVHIFAKRLPDLGRPASDARDIVKEIRDRSGLLVERRPGYFAFSHLTFQEYLCALEYVRANAIGELVDHYNDPWWHEVIVLAAPGAGGGTIPRKLLARKDASAIFLAAQCLETEVEVPLGIRKSVEKALQNFIPPRNNTEAHALAELGIVVAPILAKSLKDNKGERAFIMLAFDGLKYTPILPAIADCAGDTQPALASIQMEPEAWNLTVGGHATLILILQAERSDFALRLLKSAAYQTPLRDLEQLAVFSSILSQGVKSALRDALANRKSGTSRSKRDGSTV